MLLQQIPQPTIAVVAWRVVIEIAAVLPWFSYLEIGDKRKFKIVSIVNHK
jgi:hypothetical protein